MESSNFYQIPYTIRFKDCDAAGIVFYPRYFEMVVVLLEHWFEESLDLSFQQMHLKEHIGVPTISIDCQFSRPGLLGEKILLRLEVLDIGTTSAKLHIQFVLAKDESVKIDVKKTIVCIDLKAKKSIPWPSHIREKMKQYVK